MRSTILLCTLLSTAHADTYWDVSKDHAQKVVRKLKPGTILVRYCPGCGGAFSVIRVRSARIAPGLDDPKKHQVVVERDVLLAGRTQKRHRLVIGKARCGGQLSDWCSSNSKRCPSKEEHVDLPYTFIEFTGGRWTGLLALATGQGPTSEPPKLFLKSADARRIKRCAATVNGMPPFTLGKREAVWGKGAIAHQRGRVEVRQIWHFKRPVPRGRKVTVVPFLAGLRSINLRVVRAKTAKDGCSGDPYAKLTLAPIRRKDFAAAARKSKHEELCDAAVLHPAREKAAFVPTRSIKKRDLPKGIQHDAVRGAIDLSGNGRPDLLYVTIGEGSGVYKRTSSGWKRVRLSEPC